MQQSSNKTPDHPVVRVQIYGVLRLMLEGREALELPWQEGDTVRRLLERFQAALTIPVRHKLVDGDGVPLLGTIILLNRKNILHLDGMETAVRAGDVLALFPPGAGG